MALFLCNFLPALITQGSLTTCFYKELWGGGQGFFSTFIIAYLLISTVLQLLTNDVEKKQALVNMNKDVLLKCI